MNTTLQHGLKTRAKPRGNKETQLLAPFREGMQLITRETNLNSKIQNLGKATTIGKRHFCLYKDLVLIVGKVRDSGKEFLCNCVVLYLEVFCTIGTICNMFICNTSWD